jgi:hypothetical protein
MSNLAQGNAPACETRGLILPLCADSGAEGHDATESRRDLLEDLQAFSGQVRRQPGGRRSAARPVSRALHPPGRDRISPGEECDGGVRSRSFRRGRGPARPAIDRLTTDGPGPQRPAPQGVPQDPTERDAITRECAGGALSPKFYGLTHRPKRPQSTFVAGFKCGRCSPRSPTTRNPRVPRRCTVRTVRLGRAAVPT